MKTFVKITPEELVEKFEAISTRDILNLVTSCGIEYDTENFEYENRVEHPDGPYHLKDEHKWLGVQSLDNGLVFIGMACGGDWECSVHSLLYWDGQAIRAYVPREGNTYNKLSKCALGNNEKEDEEYINSVVSPEDRVQDPYDFDDHFYPIIKKYLFSYDKMVTEVKENFRAA